MIYQEVTKEVKKSSIFSEIYRPNEHIKIDYNTSIKNNFSDLNYGNLVTEFKINNIVTNFDYLNENNHLLIFLIIKYYKINFK